MDRTSESVVLVVVACLAAVGGCGAILGIENVTLRGGTGGSSSSSGGTGGGTGGSMITSTSTSSSSGTPACTVGDLSSCGPGRYCADTSPVSCLQCSDVAQRFAFGTLKKLDFGLPTMGTNPSYPRTGAMGELRFMYTSGNGDKDVGHADQTSFLMWGQGTAESALVNTPNGEGGELALPNGDAIKLLVSSVDVTKPILLFHRVDTTVSPFTEKVYASDGTTAEEFFIPSIPPPGHPRNYDIAVAQQAATPRLWYVSNVNDTTSDEIVTYLPGDATSTSLKVMIDDVCAAKGPINPWVDGMGNWLLFSSLSADPMNNCATVAGNRLFYVALDTTDGKPVGKAQQIFPSDKTASRTTPAMSDNLCVLYFTEVTGSSTDIYSAIRE